jgi:hypothetical protein
MCCIYFFICCHCFAFRELGALTIKNFGGFRYAPFAVIERIRFFDRWRIQPGKQHTAAEYRDLYTTLVLSYGAWIGGIMVFFFFFFFFFCWCSFFSFFI